MFIKNTKSQLHIRRKKRKGGGGGEEEEEEKEEEQEEEEEEEEREKLYKVTSRQGMRALEGGAVAVTEGEDHQQARYLELTPPRQGPAHLTGTQT